MYDVSILLVKCELVVEIVTRIKLNKDRIAMVMDDREGDGHFPFARSIDYFHGGAERAGGKRIYFIGIGHKLPASFTSFVWLPGRHQHAAALIPVTNFKPDTTSGVKFTFRFHGWNKTQLLLPYIYL